MALRSALPEPAVLRPGDLLFPLPKRCFSTRPAHGTHRESGRKPKPRTAMTIDPCDLPPLARALFEENTDALFLFAPDTGEVLDANPAARQLASLPRTALPLPLDQLLRADSTDGLQRLCRACHEDSPFRGREGFSLRRE
jgi:hypothetical protein